MNEASVVANSFIVSDNAGAGVQVGLGGTMDLHDGEVTRNHWGANIQTEGFDIQRLLDNVLIHDNTERDFDYSERVVPPVDLPTEIFEEDPIQ